MAGWIRFDTRDKKPALWNVLALSAAVAAVCAVLIRSGAQGCALAVSIVLDVYFLAVIILLLRAFCMQLQYNPYSYNTIYYTGFSLFLLSVLVTHIILTVRMIRYPDTYSSYAAQAFDQIASLLLESAKTYMLLSAPFIAVFSAALFISNISLIRNEGKRLVNVLGILLAFLMVGGEVFLFRFDYYVSGSLAEVRLHELFGNLFAAGTQFIGVLIIMLVINWQMTLVCIGASIIGFALMAVIMKNSQKYYLKSKNRIK